MTAKENEAASATKADDGLISWFKSFKYLAALMGVLTAIWALFPSFYLQGFLDKIGVPVSAFPVDSIDVPVTLHRVLMSLLLNFFVLLPDHPAYLAVGGLIAAVFTISLWYLARKREGKGSLLKAPTWRPSPAVLGLGGGLWLAATMYLLPRVIVALFASLLLLPYVAEVAGRKDAEKALGKVNACASAPADRPVECITVRYEEKGLDGKETVEQFEGMVVMGNSKVMAMLAHDGEVRLVPANVIRLTSRQPKSGSK